MKAALVTMVLLGCDCEAEHCHYLRTVDNGWDSVERCHEEVDAVTLASLDADYPLVMAVCERSGPAMSIAAGLKADPPRQADYATPAETGIAAPESREPSENWRHSSRAAIRLDSARRVVDAAYSTSARAMQRLSHALSLR